MLRLAESMVESILVRAQPSLRRDELARERVLILEVDILVRIVRIRHIAS